MIAVERRIRAKPKTLEPHWARFAWAVNRGEGGDGICAGEDDGDLPIGNAAQQHISSRASTSIKISITSTPHHSFPPAG